MFRGTAFNLAEALSLARRYEVTGRETVVVEFLILDELLPFFQRLLSELVTAWQPMISAAQWTLAFFV